MLYSTGMHASMADQSSINRLMLWSGARRVIDYLE
jgi:hypothetical protein